MRSQDERDRQTLDIASAIAGCGLVVTLGAGIVWLGSATFGDVDELTPLVVLVAGLVTGAAWLARRRR